MASKDVFIPSCSRLSVKNFAKLRKKNCPPSRNYVKLRLPRNEDEKLILDTIWGDLLESISYRKISQLDVSKSVHWDFTDNVGKLSGERSNGLYLGFSSTNSIGLDRHEILFSLELNRVKFYVESVLTSVEQAYNLLLGSAESRSYDDYFSICCLLRAGYCVKKVKEPGLLETELSNGDMVWEILRYNLQPDYCIPKIVLSDPRFSIFKTSMASIFNRTKNCFQISPSAETDTDIFNRKRKHVSKLSIYRKRQKVENVYSLNKLREFVETSIPEVDLQKYQSVFDEVKISTFDVKKLKSKTTTNLPYLALSLKKKFKEKSKESLEMVVARSSRDVLNYQQIINFAFVKNNQASCLFAVVNNLRNMQTFACCASL